MEVYGRKQGVDRINKVGAAVAMFRRRWMKARDELGEQRRGGTRWNGNTVKRTASGVAMEQRH